MYVLTKNSLQKQINNTVTVVQHQVLVGWTLARHDPKRLWFGTSRKVVNFVRTHPWVWVASPVVLLALSMVGTVANREKVQFSYANSTSCFNKLVLLPGLQKPVSSASYQLSFGRSFKLGGKALFSRQVCANLVSLPAENSTEALNFSFLGNKFIKQVVGISTPAFPAINMDKLTKAPMSASESLILPTENGQVVFEYVLSANQQKITCEKNSQNIVCPVKELNLLQAQTYTVALNREFHKKPAGVVFAGEVHTASPVEITETSIADGSTVLDKPSELILTTNKKLSLFNDVQIISGEGEAAKPIELDTLIKENKLVITFRKELDRDVKHTLSIKNLVAEDRGQLNQPFVLHFHTSGGPRVAGTNTQTYGVAVNQSFTLTFDQDLLPGQDFVGHVTLTTDQGIVPSTMSVSGRRVTLNPVSDLPKCTSFTLRVDNTIQSSYGISGSSAWQLRSRTKCVTVSIIGYSVQGRAIYAYRFGSGSSKILFVGNMHGNEKSSKYLLDSWINELEANPGRIPEGRSLIIIPTTNPDGLVSSSRFNANTVDLNRNFPADDWSSSVGVPGPQILPQGGGSAPLSEPESSALAAFVQAQQPRLVLTFHSTGSVVIANGSGDSGALATKYADKSPYWVAGDHDADEIFGYPTTGEFEDWLHDKLGIAALLIEMSTHSGYEFSGNREALWAMATLP